MFFVELLRGHRGASIESELVIILHLDFVAVHFDVGFTLVNANDIVLRVKVVEPGFGKTSLRGALRDDNVVFRMQFGYFHGGLAFVQPEFGIGQGERNHRCRAIVAEPKKDARRKEKLRLTCLRF